MNECPLLPTIALLSLLSLGACSRPDGAADQAAQKEPATPAAPTPATQETQLINKAWLVSEPTDRAPGSMYIFLGDGTLLMTSCVETYRLATWRSEAPGRLLVTEDPAVSYRVDVLEVSERDLRLRFGLARETVELKLQTADVPSVCPDLPR